MKPLNFFLLVSLLYQTFEKLSTVIYNFARFFRFLQLMGIFSDRLTSYQGGFGWPRQMLGFKLVLSDAEGGLWVRNSLFLDGEAI